MRCRSRNDFERFYFLNDHGSDTAFQAPPWSGLVDDRLPQCFGQRGNWAGAFHLKAVQVLTFQLQEALYSGDRLVAYCPGVRQ
jgi:hypothetical protein